MALCADDCGKQRNVAEEKVCVMLGAGKSSETEQDNDEAVVMGLNGVSVGLRASLLPVRSENVTVKTELVYCSCQPGRKVLV